MALNICLGLHVNFKLHCFYSVLFVCMYVIGINPVGWGGGGHWVRPTPPFWNLCPFSQKSKNKKMKNWESLSESGKLYVQAEERKHKYKYSS